MAKIRIEVGKGDKKIADFMDGIMAIQNEGALQGSGDGTSSALAFAVAVPFVVLHLWPLPKWRFNCFNCRVRGVRHPAGFRSVQKLRFRNTNSWVMANILGASRQIIESILTIQFRMSSGKGI